ncbi:MAG: C25 family cysteine peptidase [Melioribacteraceae bacterium]|nr:C25 family cysteine peptidase [Melioribacteraceae bacterium]
MRLSKLFVLFFFISISLQAQNISLRNQANQYDFVIITVNEFVPLCKEFAEHKNNSRNLKTLVTTKDHILTEFNDSTLLQDNIREFISFAGTNWASPRPQYFMFAADPDSIPNYSFASIPGYEFTDTAKSDYLYGINVLDEDTTKLSFSIGRVAARTLDELTNYFDKVINYENEKSFYDWNGNALFLADDGKNDSTVAVPNDLFENYAKEMSNSIPNYFNSKYIFQLDSSEYFGTTDSILNYINNSGVSSIYFSGYGKDSIFTDESFFSIDDVQYLENELKPFFANFLHPQYFSTKNSSSILDQMLFSKNGSLIGVAPVGVIYLHANSSINKIIWDNLYSGIPVGDVVLDAIENSIRLQNRKQNIFGDPTIVLKFNPVTDIKPYQDYLPEEFALSQNYPNPFNPTTIIVYSIPSNALNGLKVNLSVYNILGEEVAVLVNSIQNSGSYEVEFDASNLSSGAYLYRLSAGSFVQTNKMILMK